MIKYKIACLLASGLFVIALISILYLLRRVKDGGLPDIKDIDPETDVFVDCGCECHFVPPYGFIPEAGCPVHDVTDIKNIEAMDNLDKPEIWTTKTITLRKERQR